MAIHRLPNWIVRIVATLLFALAGQTVFLSLPANAARPTIEQLDLSGYKGVQLERGPDNHLLMQVRVNGQPATFFLDTGAKHTFLRADRARELGVRASGRDLREGEERFSSGVVDLRAGKMHFGETRVALLDTSQLAGALPGLKGRAADGMLGLDVLRRYKTVINCRSKQVFFKSDLTRRLDLETTTRAMGFTRVPMQDVRGYFRVRCTLRGSRGWLILDTGAFVTVLNERTAQLAGVTGSPSAMTAAGFDGRIEPVRLAQVDDLKIGGVSIAPQRLALMKIFTEPAARQSMFLEFNRVEATRRPDIGRGLFFGLLGNDLLDSQRAIIDLDSMSLFLK